MNHPVAESLLILLLLLLNGVFAMTEIAIVSSRRGILESLAEKGSAGAARALELADDPNRFLSTVQIGITLVGILAGAFGGARLVQKLSPEIARLPGVGPYAEEISFAVVIGLITYLSLVLGELVPKRLALRYPEPIAVAMAGTMMRVSKMTAPVVSLLSVSTGLLLRLFGVKEENREERMSRNEFTVLVREGLVTGSTHHAESHMIEGVFEFGELDVYDIMIPRPKMVWIAQDATHAEMWPHIIRSTQEVFPIYEGHRDNLVGAISVKEIYAQLAAGAEISFRHLMSPPLLVPETQKASTLLETFRTSGQRAAFVLDEFGGVSGMVTLIDLMESIVGDVPSKQEQLVLGVRFRSDGSCLIDGFFEIEKLERHLEGFQPPEGAGTEFQTVAGWFLQALTRIPEEGEVMEESGWSFEILDMDSNRVDKVLATPLPERTDGEVAV
ncbi:MAG: HlyC/CorC family transporter [Verrucomicrobiaceae bacterium]|nr:HlyC/CorC family transporter [Verrucomicrobiaceae bacterium]